jgi:predicted DCC family thiol-disulfide oxidoreductase YuxK
MSGRTEVQALLFALSGVLALMLLFGLRTRSASFWTWLLFTSLNSRNLYVVHGGDSLLNVVLFWGMFVPWGATYSVDNALNSSTSAQPQRLVSIGTAALLLQMPLVYFFSGVLKNGPEWRHDFTAISYVVNSPDYATLLGHWMAAWPMLILKAITVTTIVIEIGGALLLFSPVVNRTIRSLVLPAFFLLQLGLVLTMRLGLFPLISTAAILPFIPGTFWNKLFARLRTPSRMGLRIYYDGDCTFCRKAVLLIKQFCTWPDTLVEPAQASAEIYREMQLHNSWIVIDHRNRHHFRFEALTYICKQSPIFFLPGFLLSWAPLTKAGNALYERVASNRGLFARFMKPLGYRPLQLTQPTFMSLLCAFFLIYVLLDNLGTIKRTHLKVPDKLGGIGQMLRIHQNWRMFAPSPLRNYEWYVVQAKLRDGQELCFVNGVSDNCRQPGNDIPLLKNYRWRTYWRYVGSDREKKLRPYLARHICDSWNNSHAAAEHLEDLAIHKLQRPISLEGPPEQPKRIELWSGQCSANDLVGEKHLE